MNHHATYFMKTIFFTTCLALGCTSSGTLGCGSSDEGGSTVDSELLGIYQIDQYQSSQGGCDKLMDLDGSPRLVLYAAPSSESPGGAVIAGQFCDSVDDCRTRVKDFPTTANYAFFGGSDAAGWQGWGFASKGSLGDQCLYEVQSHSLTSSSDPKITIDTRQVETVFPPTVPEGSTEATCSDRDAIDSINDESPCKALFLLEATFETRL
jgi:hypothetical protein